MARNPTAPSLEDLFKLPEDYLRGPQNHALRPALIEGVERKSGQDRLLKYWPKSGTEADAELREIWRHERLQVDRVMSYPGADELFAGVVAMIETSDTFCIVHEPGPMPLAGKLRTAPRRFWMRSLEIPANRIVLWQNFARLSKALGILHSRGLLHGRIIEEAAKAAGPDLLAPLSLSGRRLFIGDHNQLPPFDSERINAILEGNAAIRSLLAGAEKAIGATFYDTGLDELVGMSADDAALEKVRAMAIRVFEPFRALVNEDESRRAVAGGTRRAVSSELLIQHRMDPTIAQLISACFYDKHHEAAFALNVLQSYPHRWGISLARIL